MKWEEKRIKQYLIDIYNSVLLNDVIKRNNIRDTALLENIADNYEKLVISTDSLISFNRNGIKQRNIMDFLLKID